MNRTQRKVLKAQKESIASCKRLKNQDIATLRSLEKQLKRTTGEEKKQLNRDIQHINKCIKKDVLLEKDFKSDIVLYKTRFAVQNSKEELVV